MRLTKKLFIYMRKPPEMPTERRFKWPIKIRICFKLKKIQKVSERTNVTK